MGGRSIVGKFRKNIVAFSLVELIATITVIMILTTIALPRYRLFVTTSRQAEAQSNLGSIASLQQSYHLEHNSYHSGMEMGMGSGSNCTKTVTSQKNLLGFRVTKCVNLRYVYTSGSSLDMAANDGNDSDRLIYPHCYGQEDKWSVDKERELGQVGVGVVEKCHE